MDGRRIGDIAGGQIGEAMVVAGSLYFDFDYNAFSQVWRVPWPAVRELAMAALRERVTTIWRLSGPVTIEAFQWMLLDEFTKALGRPIERGTPKQAETRQSRQMAEQLTAAETLNLYNEDGPAAPLSSLPITAAVAIRSATVERNGRPLRAAFRLQDEVIESARIESQMRQEWQPIEADLCGVPFRDWEDHLNP